MIALDLAAALDPVQLSRQAGITPDDWQATLLRSTAPRTLLNCSRQIGKSTTVGMLAIWTAVYMPGSLTLMLSPGLRQSTELFRKALDAYRLAGRPVAAESETTLRLELVNASRGVGQPVSTITATIPTSSRRTVYLPLREVRGRGWRYAGGSTGTSSSLVNRSTHCVPRCQRSKRTTTG